VSKPNEKLNSNIRVADAYLFGLFNDHLNMKLGLTKIPMTRANLNECFAPLTTERSIFAYTPFGTDATKFSRDMGMMVSGTFFEDHFKYSLAVMEGREGEAKFYSPFMNTEFVSTPEPSNNFSYYARAHYSFFDPEGGPTAMGYKGTYLGEKGTVLTIGGACGFEKDAAYKNTAPAGPMGTPDFFKTRVLNHETADYTAWTADIFYEQPFDNGGIITATAMYYDVDLDDAYKTANAPADQNTIVGGGSGQKDGWTAKAGYVLPFTVGDSGLVQPFARYEDWNVASFLGVKNQGIQKVGFGFNYFPLGDLNLRFSAEYSKTYFDKSTRLGDYKEFNTGNPKMYDDYHVFTLEFMVQL